MAGLSSFKQATLVPPFRNMHAQYTRDTRVSFTRGKEETCTRVKVELARDDT